MKEFMPADAGDEAQTGRPGPTPDWCGAGCNLKNHYEYQDHQ